MIKKCVVCEKEFYAPPSSKKITCGKTCSSIRKRSTHLGNKHSVETCGKISNVATKKGYTENLKKGATAERTLKNGRYTTNASAKDWILISPEKKVYKCTNLRNFIRQHIYLFELEQEEDLEDAANRIAHGFYTIKRNLLYGEGSTVTYKDWNIEIPDNRKNCEKEKK